MKAIISSKVLANRLQEIDFNSDFVERVELIESTGEIKIYSIQGVVLSIMGHVRYNAVIPQRGRRWDSVRDLLTGLPDQPIVLEVTPKNVSVIFDY